MMINEKAWTSVLRLPDWFPLYSSFVIRIIKKDKLCWKILWVDNVQNLQKNYLDQSPHGTQIFWAFSDFLNVLRLSDLLIFSELTHIFWATSDLLSYLRFSKLPQIFWVTTDLWVTSDFLTYLRFSEFLPGFSELAQIFWDC